MKIKNFYCSQGDKGDITFAQMLDLVEKDLGLEKKKFLQDIEDLYVVDESMLAYVKELKSKHHVIMLTNVMDGVIETVFRNYDLTQYFDGFIKSYQIKLAKPYKEIFQYALNSLPFKPERAVFCDDNADNVNGSTAAGLEGILFINEAKLRKDLEERGY